MGQACGTYGRRDANRVLVGNSVGMTSLRRLRSRQENNIKRYLQLGWTGLIWLKTGTHGRLLSKGQWTLGLNNWLFWVITQQVAVISYRRFGTTYRAPSSGQKSRRNHHYSMRNNPEVPSYHLLLDGSLKSRQLWGCTKCRQCLDWLRGYQRLKNDSAPRSWLQNSILRPVR